MKWYIIGIVVLVALFGLIIYLIVPKNPAGTGTSQDQNPGNLFPNSGQNSQETSGTSTSTGGFSSVSLPTRTGGTVSASDFINNGVTVPDTENPGNYYLAGSVGYCLSDGTCPSGAPASDFKVVYFSKEQAFAIGLTQEPIGQARHDAEQFMLSTLGISEADLCNINYYIGTDDEVNPTYAGKNLGFSFCPGAVALPN
jgi:hypothetical protein